MECAIRIFEEFYDSEDQVAMTRASKAEETADAENSGNEIHGAERVQADAGRSWIHRPRRGHRELRQRVISVSKADETSDAVKFVIESQPVQSTAAVSYARQVETANAQTTFQGQSSAYRADTSHQAASHAQQSEQSAFESSPEASKHCGRT